MRNIILLLTTGTLVLGGCAGSGSEVSDPGDAFADRAAQVADAWQSALKGAADKVVALQDLTITPGGDMPADVRYALDSGWYKAKSDLPQQVPDPVQAALPEGQTVTLHLVSAQQAFAAMDKGDPPCTPGAPGAPTPTGTDPGAPAGGPAQHSCTALTVAGVRLGAVDVRTNRGVVTLPAWLFTVDELPAPIARVAVDPAAFGSLPANEIGSWEGTPVSGVNNLRAVDSKAIEFVIGIGACSSDPAGLVHESADAVVLGGWARKTDPGPCIGSLALVPVTVTLAQPLGARALLDAVSGQPLL